MSLLSELKRRHVVQVGIAYLVVAWGVAQVADLVLDNYDAPRWIIQALLAALAIGFPITIALSWIFDLRWDGLHRESDLAAGNTPQLHKVDHASIAVLPFVNMSSDPEQEYFSEGISEELLNLLTKIPQLFVAARTSSFSFKGKDTGIKEIGQTLGVAHVLEGSIRKAGHTIRITAQLIKAEKGYHLWSETWDRTLEDIFAVQDEIAAIVVEKLKVHLLTPAPTAEETHPESYALYLQARHLARQGSASGFEETLALLEQALALAPDYAPAWNLRGVVYRSQADVGLRPVDDGYRLSQGAIEKALVLDQHYAQAHDSLAWIAMTYNRDLAAAARHYETALVLDPTDLGILDHAACLAVSLGRLEATLAAQEYVVARDPVNPISHNNLGNSYRNADRPEDAAAAYRTALRLSPGMIGIHSVLGLALLAQGLGESALAEIDQESGEAHRLIGRTMAYHTLGRDEESDAALAELIEKYQAEAAYNIAYVMAYRGEADRAYAWLDKAVEYHDPGLAGIVTEPEFAPIKDDPRWDAFLTRIGKSKAQLDAIAFEFKLPE